MSSSIVIPAKAGIHGSPHGRGDIENRAMSIENRVTRSE